MKKLFSEIDRLFDKYVSVWVDICNIESPTNKKENVDRVGDYFATLAADLGWNVERFDQPLSGDCLCITMNAEAEERPIALSGHMDTVHPVGSFGTPATRIQNNIIYGPGVVDCKGGIVASCLAMEALQAIGFTKRPVLLLLQSDEENSSITSEKRTVAYMAEKAKNAVAFLNCEGHKNGALVIERKGIIRYQFDVQGQAAHSSQCHSRGASAIREAAYKIIELEKWKEKNGITCNCGVIQGGTVANTVPEHCTFIVDIRYKTADDLKKIKEEVQRIANTSYIEQTTCTLSIKSQRISMEKNERNMLLFRQIQSIFDKNGLPHVELISADGGSDAADISAYGIPCVDSIGIQGKNIHSVHEQANIESLREAARRIASVVASLQ